MNADFRSAFICVNLRLELNSAVFRPVVIMGIIMGTRKDTHKVGTPPKPRGQQTGFAGNPDQNREEIEKTPALRGRRKKANEMFADASEQHVASNPVTPSTNAPSTVVNVGTKKHKKNRA